MKIRLAENGDILIHNSEEILNEILLVFDNNGHCIIDFEGVKSMTTSFSANLFGKLYCKLGACDYYNHIEFINLSDDLRILMRLGLEKHMESLIY